MALVFRVTTWSDEAGAPLQVSFGVLDESWDLLYEATKPCGPFHPFEEQIMSLKDDWRRHLRLYGYSPELWSS